MDIENQRDRILTSSVNNVLAGVTPRGVARQRFVRASAAADRYMNNIALTDSYQRSALAGNERKANVRKYSSATYRGVRQVGGGGK